MLKAMTGLALITIGGAYVWAEAFLFIFLPG